MTEASGPRPDLQQRLLAEILAFPGRLDAMEHRDEQCARELAERLAASAEAEIARRVAGSRAERRRLSSG